MEPDIETATRVFSGNSVATGDDLGDGGSDWEIIVAESDTAYAVDGLYAFMLWNNASSGTSHAFAQFFFRPSHILVSSTHANHYRYGKGTSEYILVRRNGGGIQMRRSAGDPDNNKWELVRIA